jgi:hypothetical protein
MHFHALSDALPQQMIANDEIVRVVRPSTAATENVFAESCSVPSPSRECAQPLMRTCFLQTSFRRPKQSSSRNLPQSGFVGSYVGSKSNASLRFQDFHFPVAGSLGPDRDLSEQVPICHVFYLQRASQMFHGFRLDRPFFDWLAFLTKGKN